MQLQLHSPLVTEKDIHLYRILIVFIHHTNITIHFKGAIVTAYWSAIRLRGAIDFLFLIYFLHSLVYGCNPIGVVCPHEKLKLDRPNQFFGCICRSQFGGYRRSPPPTPQTKDGAGLSTQQRIITWHNIHIRHFSVMLVFGTGSHSVVSDTVRVSRSRDSENVKQTLCC